MPHEIAVVFDVAGTILKMYRVAKDISTNRLMEKVITWKLIMEKCGRALIVPNIEPKVLVSGHPEDLVNSIFNIDDGFEISCSSAVVSKTEVIDIIFQSRVRLADIQEVFLAVKAKCPAKYQTIGMIIDTNVSEITYTISTGGVPFSGLDDVLKSLENLGVEVYIASGDSMRSLLHLTEYGIRSDRIFPVANPNRKYDIIMELKNNFDTVIMVGDGLNDIYALQASDLGILTVQQNRETATELIDAADCIIDNINELPVIIRAHYY